MKLKTHPRGGRAPLNVPRIEAPKMDVVPSEPGLKIAHPIDGRLPDAGGKWTRDQFTFRMLQDGTIKVASEKVPATAPEPAAEIAVASVAPAPAADDGHIVAV